MFPFVKRVVLMLIVLCALASAAATGVQAQGDPFTLRSNSPVVSHGKSSSDWDSRYTDPGAVFYHDGKFHMLRNGFKDWPDTVQIGYLTSVDGIKWTEATEDPVLRTADVPYAEIAALATSALVQDDGTWVLYFYTWNKGATPEGVIGRATAKNPLGPWTVDEKPVLTGGGAGSWDHDTISSASVVRTATEYVMYYSGSIRGGKSAVGMATSTDGIVWTKYNDPATADALYVESDPVFMSPINEVDFHQPRVEKTETGYVMIFRQFPTANPGNMGLGIATSRDGIAWTVVTEGQFWRNNTIPGTQGFWWTATAYHDKTLYLYIEGGRGRVTDIYVATSTETFLKN